MLTNYYFFKLFTTLTLTLLTTGEPEPVDSRNQTAKTTSFLRLHQRKCHEYQRYVYRYVYTVGLAIGEDPKKIRIDECTHKNDPLLVGEEDAKFGEFPHMAIIGYEHEVEANLVICTGSLISERFVLSAAHCLDSPRIGNATFVKLGELDVVKSNRYVQRIPVEEIILYPLYKEGERYHDIALLKLSRDATLNSHIIPACLPSTLEDSEQRYIAAGWKVPQNGFLTSITHLRKVGFEKFSIAECKNAYSEFVNNQMSNGIRSNNQICSGSRIQDIDICESGGPLQLYHPNEYCMYILSGVSSFSYKCGLEDVPGVYTRLANYIAWIELIIWPGESLGNANL